MGIARFWCCCVLHFLLCLGLVGGSKTIWRVILSLAWANPSPLWLSVHLIINLFCTCQMPSAEIWLDGYHGLMQKPFQSLISLQSSSFTCSLFSKKGLPKVFMRLWIKVRYSAECILKRKGVAKIDWSTLLIISSIECIIYWASNKSVHKHSTQQRFYCLGAFNVYGSPFLLLINHNALTVLLEPASVLTVLSSVPTKSWHSWRQHLFFCD